MEMELPITETKRKTKQTTQKFKMWEIQILEQVFFFFLILEFKRKFRHKLIRKSYFNSKLQSKAFSVAPFTPGTIQGTEERAKQTREYIKYKGKPIKQMQSNRAKTEEWVEVVRD